MHKSSKKIISSIIAIIFSVIISVPLIVNALINYNDPNGDYSIEANDSVLINQYLSGSVNVSNLETMDFDNNYIISKADSYKIQLYNLGLMNSGTINHPSAVTYNGSSSETYFVFDATTGNRIINNTYILLNNSNVVINNIESEVPDTVIGDDGRVPNWDRTGVVKIIMSDGFGTGFVVAPHVIATAAHCAYNYANTSSTTGQIIDNILLFNNSGVNTLSATPVECHVPYSYINKTKTESGSYTNEFDYALITVEEDLSDYMCFKLGVALNAAPINNVAITNAGFPGIVYPNTPLEQTVNTLTLHNMYQCTGNLMDLSVFEPDRQLFYNADTSGGNSGGPIYVSETVQDKNGNNTQVYYSVIAINVAGASNFNIGTRMNSELIHFYLHNSNLHW